MGAYTYTYTYSIHCHGPIPTTVFDGYKTYHLLGVIKSYPSKILNQSPKRSKNLYCHNHENFCAKFKADKRRMSCLTRKCKRACG